MKTAIIILLLTNLLRGGDIPIVLDEQLNERAQVRAEGLCNAPFTHEGWLTSFSGISYRAAGENLARGFHDPWSAFIGWMESPTHKANLVKAKYTHMGVGEACGVIVQLFQG